MTVVRSSRTALVALCMILAACGGGEDAAPATAPPFETTDATTSTTRPDPLAVDDVDAATRARVIGELRGAFEAVQSQPIEITLEMTEEGSPSTATIRLDRSAEVLEGELVTPLGAGAAVTTRHVIVDGRMFFKSTTSAEAEAILDFTELTYEPNARELMDEVYAGYARINKTLDRMLLLLENVPFAAQVTEGGQGTEISVIMSPFAIYDYYGESGLEAVGGAVPPEPTRLAFLIEDGVLRGLVADGTHFHDGEALEVSASVLYTPIEPFTPEAPSIQE